jgi:hypothetical protein
MVGGSMAMQRTVVLTLGEESPLSTSLPRGWPPSADEAYEAALGWTRSPVDTAEAAGRAPEDYVPDPQPLATAFCALMQVPPTRPEASCLRLISSGGAFTGYGARVAQSVHPSCRHAPLQTHWYGALTQATRVPMVCGLLEVGESAAFAPLSIRCWCGRTSFRYTGGDCGSTPRRRRKHLPDVLL